MGQNTNNNGRYNSQFNPLSAVFCNCDGWRLVIVITAVTNQRPVLASSDQSGASIVLLLSDLLEIAISVGSSVSVDAHWNLETGIIPSDQGHYPLTSDDHWSS